MGAEVFAVLKGILQQKGLTTAVGDEGGVAPDLRSNEEAFDLLLEAVTQAGYTPGRHVSLALDIAATELYQDGHYVFHKAGGAVRQAEDLVQQYAKWATHYPLVSIEDGLAEDDWSGVAIAHPGNSAQRYNSWATTCLSPTRSGSRAALRTGRRTPSWSRSIRSAP